MTAPKDSSKEIEWTKKRPSEPGWYWVHGWLWRMEKEGHEPELELALVMKVSNGLLFFARGHSLEEGCHDLLWAPAELPEPPKRVR